MNAQMWCDATADGYSPDGRSNKFANLFLHLFLQSFLFYALIIALFLGIFHEPNAKSFYATLEHSMFTGIIECFGFILFSRHFNGQKRLRIQPLSSHIIYKKGDSIAINGVCLTVDNLAKDWFEVYTSLETLRTTNLEKINTGELVNLELALQLGQRLGGHLVSGHVDCLAIVKKIINAHESKIFHLNFDRKYGKYFVPKGSIALDGVSLTVNNCGEDFLEVNVIPETLRKTIISKWKPGYAANMEIDMVSKYLQYNKNSKMDLGSLLTNCFNFSEENTNECL